MPSQGILGVKKHTFHGFTKHVWDYLVMFKKAANRKSST